MLEGVFKFKGITGPVWVDLTSVDAFVVVGTQKGLYDVEILRVEILFRNGKLTTILTTEQEIDEVIKQHRVDR